MSFIPQQKSASDYIFFNQQEQVGRYGAFCGSLTGQMNPEFTSHSGPTQQPQNQNQNQNQNQDQFPYLSDRELFGKSSSQQFQQQSQSYPNHHQQPQSYPYQPQQQSQSYPYQPQQQQQSQFLQSSPYYSQSTQQSPSPSPQTSFNQFQSQTQSLPQDQIFNRTMDLIGGNPKQPKGYLTSQNI
jgi:hypothetical protein